MENVKKRKSNRTGWKYLLLLIASFVMVVCVGVVVFLRYYDSYIDGILYNERLHQMREVTDQLFQGIEKVVQNQWDSTDIFCNYLELGNPADIESLHTFMGKQAKLNNMEAKMENLVAVDDLGRYLTQDGWQGTLEEMDLLMDEPEKVSFVSKSMTSNDTYMYFLKRLEEPVTFEDGSRTVRLIYYGVSQNMEQLNPYFTCDAYDNSNSVYVLNKSGTRFFLSNDDSKLHGYNVYKTLSEMQYLHGNSFEEAKSELDTEGCGYSNAILDGEEYYYALYHMDNAEWTLLFLVPSSYVAIEVVSMVRATVKMILIFAILLLAAASFVIYLILRFQQRQALERERRNNEQLEAINEQLDYKNGLLTKATRVAEEANKAKTDFLANMSHDIRTPMNAIVGITNLMAHEKDDPEKLDAYIQKVQSSSKHLLSLINDVLDMSKIEASDVTLNMEPINLAEQVSQIDSIVRSQINEKNQSFEIRVHEIVHEFLLGDGIRLRQVCINLLSNAVKYTPRGGEITLDIAETACEEPGYARLSIVVTDNGYGMAPEFVEKIFDPFTRAENSTTNKVQGTGLGMAITKNIVDLMGGTISVESERGKGSCFTVSLHLTIDEDAVCILPAEHALLISQDEVLNRNVQASFQNTKAMLETVHTVEEAVDIVTKRPADVVLLNGYLQDDSLQDIVKMLKTASGQKGKLYCCEYADPEQVQGMLHKCGVDGLLARPFFLSNLAGLMNRTEEEAVSVELDDASLLRGMKFLCAEDNDLNAEILTAILDMEGASCTIYADGKAIVDAFADVKPGEYDAILMDVQMPVMNGLEAASAIRKSANPIGKTIPIIAMTANAFSSDVQACLDAGMDAHVSKPLDIAVLVRTLKGLKHARFFGGGNKCSPAMKEETM